MKGAPLCRICDVRHYGVCVPTAKEPAINKLEKRTQPLEKRTTHGGARPGAGRPRKWNSDAERMKAKRDGPQTPHG